MCCSGHFALVCNDEIIQSKGKPCKYLSSSDSCTIYSNRPECCKIFMCLYRQDDSVPEWIKPNISQVIMTERVEGDIEYIEVFDCGSKIQDNLLEWIYNRHIEKKQNVVINYNNLYYLLATNDNSYQLLHDFQTKQYNRKVQNAYTLPFFSKYLENNNLTDKI